MQATVVVCAPATCSIALKVNSDGLQTPAARRGSGSYGTRASARWVSCVIPFSGLIAKRTTDAL